MKLKISIIIKYVGCEFIIIVHFSVYRNYCIKNNDVLILFVHHSIIKEILKIYTWTVIRH